MQDMSDVSLFSQQAEGKTILLNYAGLREEGWSWHIRPAQMQSIPNEKNHEIHQEYIRLSSLWRFASICENKQNSTTLHSFHLTGTWRIDDNLLFKSKLIKFYKQRQDCHTRFLLKKLVLHFFKILSSRRFWCSIPDFNLPKRVKNRL